MILAALGLIVVVFAPSCPDFVTLARGDFPCPGPIGPTWATQTPVLVAVGPCVQIGFENETCCTYADAVGISPGPVLTTVDNVTRRDCYPGVQLNDSLQVQVMITDDPIFADGFETGDVSAWSGRRNS